MFEPANVNMFLTGTTVLQESSWLAVHEIEMVPLYLHMYSLLHEPSHLSNYAPFT